jgi:hypothetical protein
MLEVYGFVVWGGLCLSILAPVIFFVMIQRRVPMVPLVRVAILLLSIFACVIVGPITTFVVAEELQAIAALPYIQVALQNQCPNKQLLADRKGFKIVSTMNWVSENANVTCFFNNVEWRCDCNN